MEFICYLGFGAWCLFIIRVSTFWFLNLLNMSIQRVLEEEILPFVRRPARYVGGEINSVEPGASEVNVLLSYPDLYEVGMSYLGIRLIYDLINRMDFCRAERTFAVAEDMESLMREKKLPLFSLESFRPAADFDLWGFSLQAELTYTNILNMLDLAGLPPRAEERSWPGSPLIMAGGIGAYNPEPLADFFDLFLIGDAEEGLRELLGAFRRLRREERGKEDLLRALVQEVPGWYAPALYRPRYFPGGRFSGLEPADASLPSSVKKRILKDLNLSAIRRPLVPITEVVHDRTVVEVMRGCPRGCRFCAAGWTGRPVREKSPETVAIQVREEMEQSGANEVSLLSLSSGDYRGIEPVLTELAPQLAARRIGISLPSLNVASVKSPLLEAVKLVRKSGVTMAPEAGSPRLQAVINKKLDPELLWRISREVRKMGWRLIKLYFMIGLPTETDDDIRGLAGMINRMAGWGGGLNVTISNFVPKAGTPFQWVSLSSPGELRRKQNLIRDLVRSRRVKLKFRRPELSLLEGVIARGDRRIGELIRAAWEEGARFDDWGEYFDPRKWETAWEKTGLDREFYQKFPYGHEEVLPWSHIETGVPRSILVKEAKKAVGEAGRNGEGRGDQGIRRSDDGRWKSEDAR